MDGKLGLYDILGRVVPGAFILWAMVWMGFPSGVATVVKIDGSFGTVAMLALSYVIGLGSSLVGRYAIQALVFKLGGAPTTRFLKGNAAVVGAFAQDGLEEGLRSKEADKLATHAFYTALSKVEDTSAKVQAMQAQYGLHRNLAGSCLALSVISLYGVIAGHDLARFFLGWILAAAAFAYSSYGWGIAFARAAFYGAIEKAKSA